MTDYMIVDVFAERRYAGNQLAVVLDDRFDTGTMQQIAREFNFSETTFIGKSANADGSWPVRIFTPRSELPFAGHPTLGSAWVIQQRLLKKHVPEVAISVKAGKVPVGIDYDGDTPSELTMHQLPPSFGRTADPAAVAASLGLPADAIDERFPCLEVETGIWTLVVPLKTLDALDSIKVDLPKHYAIIGQQEAKDFFVFCPETSDSRNQIAARMFADYFGVPEDPATGSANGCLAAYLVHTAYFGNADIDLHVEQGVVMGRPSRLHLRAGRVGDRIAVRVGGRVISVAEGRLTAA